MNGMQMIIIKQALDKIDAQLYKELPLAYADKATEIINNAIKEVVKNIGDVIGIKK